MLGAALLIARPAGAQEAEPMPADTLARGSAPEAEPAADDSTAVRDGERGTAGADSVWSVCDEPPQSVHGGGDVRLVRGGGVAEAVAAVQGVRTTGIGWPCQRVSIADGVLPAAATGIVVARRDGDDWLTGGVDLLSSWATASGAVVALDGPDLSLWPASSSATLTALGGPSSDPASGALFSVRVSPGRPAGPTPHARVTLREGSRGFDASAVEFGRTFFSGGVGLQGFLDQREGRGPVAGGLSRIGSFGGSIAASYPGRLCVRVDGVRSEVKRGLPLPGLAPSSLLGRLVRSDVTLSVIGERLALRCSRTVAWLRSERALEVGSVESTVDGCGIDLFVGWAGVDSLALRVEAREAKGPLLTGPASATGGRGLATKVIALPSGSCVSLVVGAESLGDDAYPLGRVSFSSAGRRSTGGTALVWRADVRAGGRHPGVLERLLRPTSAPSPEGAPVLIGGNGSLSAERAVVASASCERGGASLDAGVRAEALLALSPVSLVRSVEGVARLENGDPETAGLVTAWARSGGGGFFGWLARVDARFLHDDGALSAVSPVPRLALEGGLWVSHHIFARDFVDARLQVSVSHESGRARGPWEGALDDQSTAVGVAATGQAGPARFYAAVEDLFETADGRLPGIGPFGRRVTAGFSWEFWD
jgi:hypothetical protein